MASIGNDANGRRRILFYSPDGSRRTLRLGKCSKRDAESIKVRVEQMLTSKISGRMDRELSVWIAGLESAFRSKLEQVGLLEPLTPKVQPTVSMAEHIDEFIVRVGATKKPGTVAVWKQVRNNLIAHMPTKIELAKVTKGHAKAFHEALKGRGLAGLTIAKHVRIARQIFQDAVDWEKITANPFAGLRASASIPKNNVEVTRATIETVLAHSSQTWKAIIALSRYGGLRTPSEVLSLKWSHVDFENSVLHIPEPKVEHHEGRGLRLCPMFPELRDVLRVTKAQATNTDDYVIDKPLYRKAADTGEGWKNSNLRTQFLKILKKAGVEPWPRLFHSMRASRQTELERQFPLHVVCAWLGNSPKVAQRSYLLVTTEDFQRATKEPDLRGTKSGTRNRKSGTKSGTVSASTESQAFAENPEKHWEKGTFPHELAKITADGEGFEIPANLQGKTPVLEGAARKAARSASEALLLDLWAQADDSARLKAIEILKSSRRPT